MLFFGHIGIAIFLGTFLYLSPLIVGISAVLPDLVDKGLLLFGLSQYTRLFAHNIFFGPIVGLITYVITRRKDFAFTMLFGTYMHLLQDIRTPLPWLWPFVNYNFLGTEIKIILDAFTILTEAIGLSLLVILFAFRQNVLHLRERMYIAFKDFYDKRLVKKI